MNSEQYEKFDIAPVEIMKYFDIQKDSKFSSRTLLLLSSFTIAVFGFGISPTVGNIAIAAKDYKSFSVFIFFAIIVQSIISIYAYQLYKSHIDNLITHLKNDIIKIKEVIKGIPTRNDLSSEQKVSHKVFMEAKLANYENVRKNSKMFYKNLTGRLPLFMAVFAIISIIFFLIKNHSIYESIIK